MQLHLLVSHTVVVLVLSACKVCVVAQPCNFDLPFIEESPRSVTISVSADQLVEATAECRKLLPGLLRKWNLENVVDTAASASYTQRQDLAALLNAVSVLGRLGIVNVSSIIKHNRLMTILSKPAKYSQLKKWPIAWDELYDTRFLATRASSARRSEAIVDMMRILQKSHPDGIFRRLKDNCPKLTTFWEKGTSTLLRLRCSANNTEAVTWYKNDSPLKPSHRVNPFHYGTTWYLNIIDPRILDAGWYTCEAHNSCGRTPSAYATVNYQIVKGV